MPPLPVLRAAFWAAAAFAFVMASLPNPPQVPGQPSDKIQHIVAFLVLTTLAMAAYPRTSRLKLLLGLSAFGAAIELIQTIPQLHRDADVIDWAADSAAVAVVLAAGTAIERLRRRSL